MVSWSNQSMASLTNYTSPTSIPKVTTTSIPSSYSIQQQILPNTKGEQCFDK